MISFFFHVSGHSMCESGFVKLSGFILLLCVRSILCSFTYCTHMAIKAAKAIAILQNNRRRSRCLTSEIFFSPGLLWLKIFSPRPMIRTRGCLLEAFFNDLGRSSNIRPPIMTIHPTGKTHMNVTDVFFFYLCKGIIHPVKIFKKYIVKIKITWVNKITIVASQHVCYSCINYMEMAKHCDLFQTENNDVGKPNIVHWRWALGKELVPLGRD